MMITFEKRVMCSLSIVITHWFITNQEKINNIVNQ